MQLWLAASHTPQALEHALAARIISGSAPAKEGGEEGGEGRETGRRAHALGTASALDAVKHGKEVAVCWYYVHLCVYVCVCVCVCVMQYEYMHARHACMEELGKGKGGMLALSCTWITRAKAACCTLITL